MYTLLSRGCHLGPDEARGRMPVPVGPAERGRLPGASPLLRQGFVEPGRVVHPVSLILHEPVNLLGCMLTDMVRLFCFACVLQERSDEGAVAPFARDASPRDGRVVAEPGVQDPVAKNVTVASQSVYEMD